MLVKIDGDDLQINFVHDSDDSNPSKNEAEVFVRCLEDAMYDLQRTPIITNLRKAKYSLLSSLMKSVRDAMEDARAARKNEH